MKREIKFRVWTSFGMFHNVSVHDGDTFGMSNDDFYKTAKKPKDQEGEDWDDLLCEYNFMDCGEDWLQGDGQIMQFTGLKDKNGKDIYEGDIVRWFKTEYDWNKGCANKIDVYSKIVYRNHGFWVNDEGFGYEGEDLWNWEEMEVVGNIFENAELITP